MNSRFNNVAARVAAGTGLVFVSAVVGCSGSDKTPVAAGPGASGSTSASGATMSGGMTNSAGTGGSAGSVGGDKCPGNQLMQSGACACPGYAATWCEAMTKCVSEKKDPDNCGACGMACGATSACAAGVCTPELATLGELAGCGTLLLVNAPGKLYALSTMSGELNAFTLPAGGAPTKLGTVAGGTAFAVDAMNAYVASGMSIQRLPLAGGNPSPVVTEGAAIHDVAVVGSTLYYATGTGVKSIATTANNGTPAPVLVALAASEGEPHGITASGSVVLYGSTIAQNVERCDTTMNCRAGEGTDVEERGPGHHKIGQSQGGLVVGHRSLQTDGTLVFWINNGLQSAPIMPDADGNYPGKGVATPLNANEITAYATAGTKAYFTEKISPPSATDPQLVDFETSDFDATESVWVARNLPLVTSIVVDASGVYLASGCKVLKSAL